MRAVQQRPGLPGRATTTTWHALRPPRVPGSLVPRERLWGALDATDHVAVRVVVAPAGSGKTLGVAGWVHSRGRGGDVRWVGSAAGMQPDDLDAVLRGVDSSEEAAPGTLPPALVVLDDAHLMPYATTLHLDRLLCEDPATLRLLLLARWDLPLRRLVPELTGDLAVLRGGLLRFDQHEAAALVRTHARTDSAEVIGNLTERADGWCAALVLLSRAVAPERDQEAAARRLNRGGTSVVDAVAGEVFHALDRHQRHLLLCAAHEASVTERLAVELTGDPQAGDVLRRLEETGLMVSRDASDDDAGEDAYSVHPILAEIAGRRLRAGGVDVDLARATVSAAVTRSVLNHDSTGAVQRLTQVGAVTSAGRLLVDHGLTLVCQGQAGEIRRFVRDHPEEVEGRVEAWFPLAFLEWATDEPGEAARWLDRVVVADETSVPRITAAAARVVRGLLSLEPLEPALAAGLTIEAQPPAGVPPAPGTEVVLQLVLGIACTWTDRWEESESLLGAVVGWAQTHGLTALSSFASSHLALTRLMRGDAQGADSLALRVLDGAGPRWHFPSTSGRARLTLGLTRADLSECPAPGATYADPLTTFLARLCDHQRPSGRASRDPRSGLTLGDGLPPMGRVARLTQLVAAALHAHLYGDRGTVMAVAREFGQLQCGPGEQWAAGLLAEQRGALLEAARHYVQVGAAGQEGAAPVAAIAWVMGAQLLEAQGRHTAALAAIGQAVEATELSRSVVAFLGFGHVGAPVRPLLVALREGGDASEWLRFLIDLTAVRVDLASAFRETHTSAAEAELAQDHLVAPRLSVREREVLRELGRGSTYALIAANLCVSENTVKSHVAGLYRKLAATRRSEALATARSLGLL